MGVEKNVRDFLKRRGIKQTFIAEKCGWTKQRTSNLVCGKKKMTADELAAICEAVEVPYDYFYHVQSDQQSKLGA